MSNSRKKKKATTKSKTNDPGLGVVATANTDGYTPLTVVAYVEYVGPDGEHKVQRLVPDWLTEERAQEIVDAAQ